MGCMLLCRRFHIILELGQGPGWMGCRPIFHDLTLYPMYFNGFQFFSPGSFVCENFRIILTPAASLVQVNLLKSGGTSGYRCCNRWHFHVLLHSDKIEIASKLVQDTSPPPPDTHTKTTYAVVFSQYKQLKRTHIICQEIGGVTFSSITHWCIIVSVAAKHQHQARDDHCRMEILVLPRTSQDFPTKNMLITISSETTFKFLNSRQNNHQHSKHCFPTYHVSPYGLYEYRLSVR